MADLGNKIISSNYQKLLQISGSGEVSDGTGSAFPLKFNRNTVGINHDPVSGYSLFVGGAISASNLSVNPGTIFLGGVTMSQNSDGGLTFRDSGSNELGSFQGNGFFVLSSSLAGGGTGRPLFSMTRQVGSTQNNNVMQVDLTSLKFIQGTVGQNGQWKFGSAGSASAYSKDFFINDNFTLNPTPGTNINNPAIYITGSTKNIGLGSFSNSTNKLDISGSLLVSGPKGHITASGNISASGIITAEGLVISDDFSLTDDLTVGGNITASGDISASGKLFALGADFGDHTITNVGVINVDSVRADADSNVDISLTANGINFDVNNSDTFQFNGNESTADLEYRDSGGDNIFHIDESLKSTTIGVKSEDPKSTLHVAGDITVKGDGHITASGNISSSGTITSNGGVMSDNLFFSDDKGLRFGDAGQGILGSAASNTITIDGNDTINIQADELVDIKGGLTKGVNIDGNITASGNISASGDILTSGNITSLGTGSFSHFQINNKIQHTGDANTFIQFTPDTQTFKVGDVQLLQLTEGSSDEVIVGDGSNSITFRVKTPSEVDTIVVDPTLNLVGFGKLPGNSAKIDVDGNIRASGGITASGDIKGGGNLELTASSAGNITFTGNISGSITSTGSFGKVKVATSISLPNNSISGDKVEGGTIAAITITDLTATSLNVTHFTSSFITASTIVTEGSNTFGDTIADKHTFNGHITASGNISSSGTITSNGGVMSDNLFFSDDKGLRFGDAGQGILGSAASNNITIDGNDTINIQADVLVDIKGGLTKGVNIDGNITASGNISSSGDILTSENLITLGNISGSITSTGSFGSVHTDGNVGIGTTSPAETLDISGSGIKIHNGNQDGTLKFFRFSSEIGRISSANSRLSIKGQNNKAVSIEDNAGNIGFFLKDGGNVGIGTAAPTETLQVTGTISASGDLFVNNITASAGNFSSHITASGNISSSGTGSFTGGGVFGDNVGIGTKNPQALLHLTGTGGATSGITFTNAHNDVDMFFSDNNANSDFQITYVGTGGAELTLEQSGDLLLNASNGDNVGIGNTTPVSKLDITGDMKVSSHITASGNISSSGNISAFTGTGSFGSVHTAGNISASGTTHTFGEVNIDATHLFPTPDNGLALGKVGNEWADLFLNAGGVINFDNDMTITHLLGGNNLGIAGGSLSASGDFGVTGNATLGDAAADTHTITGKTSFVGNITASGNISASGKLIGSGLNISGDDVDFNNLPVSQSGLNSGQLYTLSGSQLPFSGSVAAVGVFNTQKFVLISK